MSFTQYLVPAVSGLVSGVVGSLIAPWSQWGVEARRERMKARRELLSEVRSLLTDPPSLAEFRRLPIYFQIKEFLPDETNEIIAGQFDKHGREEIQVVLGGPYEGVNVYAHKVLNDLVCLEKKWGLL